jgi:AraC family transcriptional regulator of arabinose operon
MGWNRLPAGVNCWRENGVKDWTIICTMSGNPYYRFDGGEMRAPADTVVLIRPNVCHDYGTLPGRLTWETIWSVFDPPPQWLPYLRWPEHAPGFMSLRLSDAALRRRVLSSLKEAHALANGGLRHREVFAMNALEAALLWCDAQNPNSQQAQLDPRVRRVLDQICRHLDRPHSLQSLATSVGVSVSHLMRLFRGKLGLTPIQFIERERITRAKQMLELTPLTIQAIAWEVGYEDPFYFTQRFKKQTGLSPRAYRTKSHSQS